MITIPKKDLNAIIHDETKKYVIDAAKKEAKLLLESFRWLENLYTLGRKAWQTGLGGRLRNSRKFLDDIGDEAFRLAKKVQDDALKVLANSTDVAGAALRRIGAQGIEVTTDIRKLEENVKKFYRLANNSIRSFKDKWRKIAETIVTEGAEHGSLFKLLRNSINDLRTVGKNLEQAAKEYDILVRYWDETIKNVAEQTKGLPRLRTDLAAWKKRYPDPESMIGTDAYQEGLRLKQEIDALERIEDAIGPMNGKMAKAQRVADRFREQARSMKANIAELDGQLTLIDNVYEDVLRKARKRGIDPDSLQGKEIAADILRNKDLDSKKLIDVLTPDVDNVFGKKIQRAPGRVHKPDISAPGVPVTSDAVRIAQLAVREKQWKMALWVMAPTLVGTAGWIVASSLIDKFAKSTKEVFEPSEASKATGKTVAKEGRRRQTGMPAISASLQTAFRGYGWDESVADGKTAITDEGKRLLIEKYPEKYAVVVTIKGELTLKLKEPDNGADAGDDLLGIFGGLAVERLNIFTLLANADPGSQSTGSARAQLGENLKELSDWIEINVGFKANKTFKPYGRFLLSKYKSLVRKIYGPFEIRFHQVVTANIVSGILGLGFEGKAHMKNLVKTMATDEPKYEPACALLASLKTRIGSAGTKQDYKNYLIKANINWKSEYALKFLGCTPEQCDPKKAKKADGTADKDAPGRAWAGLKMWVEEFELACEGKLSATMKLASRQFFQQHLWRRAAREAGVEGGGSLEAIKKGGEKVGEKIKEKSPKEKALEVYQQGLDWIGYGSGEKEEKEK